MAKQPKKTNGNGTSEASAVVAENVESKTIDILDQSVPLSNKFMSMLNQPLTADFLKIVFEHVSGQFRNNQVANAKARKARYEAATTDAEREANKPLTVADYLEIWNGNPAKGIAPYMPNVGGGLRLGAMEKARLDAAIRAWTEAVTEHNAAVAAGNEPIIAKAAGNANVKVFTYRHKDSNGNVMVYHSRPRKGKDMSEDEHKLLTEGYDTTLETFKRTILDTPWMAERVQKALDAILAERGAKADETPSADAEASDALL
jgi:hypothetical protein